MEILNSKDTIWVKIQDKKNTRPKINSKRQVYYRLLMNRLFALHACKLHQLASNKRTNKTRLKCTFSEVN